MAGGAQGRPEHSVEGSLFVRSWPGSAPERPPILFLHGLGESGLGFEPLAASEGLAAWPRRVPDLPGYGRSAWPKEALGLEAHADAVAMWLGDGEPCVVVGHSMGAVIGLLLAERHPERVAMLVDVEGNKSEGDCAFSGRTLRWTAEEFEDEGFAKVCASVLGAAAADPPLATYYASLRQADPRTFHRNGRELVELSRREELAPRLARLACPAVYVGGVGRPGGVCPRSLELLDEAGIQAHLVSPAGHWLFIDQPERFLALLRQVLEELPSRTAAG